jgi:diketogulonate reductase-like aldo/keto reductase
MLGFGTFRLTSEDAYKMTVQALQKGYRLIDTAKLYKNEESVQRAIVDSGINRDEIFLITKIHKCTMATLDERIKIFGQIDCLLLHYPTEQFIQDWTFLCKNKPSEVRYLGVSNFKQHHLDESSNVLKPYCNQIEVTPFWTRKDLVQYNQSHSIITIAHSPLAKAEKFDDPRLIEMADKYHTTPSTLMINWSLDRQFWTLPRTSKLSHLQQNQTRIIIQEEDLITMDSWNECYATHPQYR